jgi:tRNA(fMet)-specific endonuclease VapC
VFVLDTNVVIHYFKGQGQVAERLLSTPPNEVALPSIAVFELEVGVLRSDNVARRREQLRLFLEVVATLPFGRAEATAAAQVRAALETQGLPIGPFDVLIAGTALAHHATLVTRNTREFGRVDGLTVENWYE